MAITAHGAAVGGTAGASIVLAWAARQFAHVELPADVALIIAGGLAWLAHRLTDGKGRHERE